MMMTTSMSVLLLELGQGLNTLPSWDETLSRFTGVHDPEEDYVAALVREQGKPLIVVENSPLVNALRTSPTRALVVPELRGDAILSPDGIFVCATRPGGPECAHYHKRQWETYVCLRGEFTMRARWRWETQWQPEVVCPPGTIVIVRPQVVHQLAWKSSDGFCVVHRAPPDPTDKVVVDD